MTTRKANAEGPGKPGPVPDEAFRVVAGLEGFDINGFDAWLAAMKDCGAKEELTERRSLAAAAVTRNGTNTDALLRHLEWMQLRWQHLKATNYLRPLARTGKAVDEGRRKPKRPQIQEWIDAQVKRNPGETAKELWARAPDWITDPDYGIQFDRFVKRRTDARKKVGIGRK